MSNEEVGGIKDGGSKLLLADDVGSARAIFFGLTGDIEGCGVVSSSFRRCKGTIGEAVLQAAFKYNIPKLTTSIFGFSCFGNETMKSLKQHIV